MTIPIATKPTSTTFGAVLADFRNTIIVEEQARRAAEPPSGPAPANLPREVVMAAGIIERLLAQTGGDAGAMLPPDLAGETCAALDAVPKPPAEVPSMVGASARRSQESLGRAAGYTLLRRANEIAVSAAAGDAFLKARGIVMPDHLGPLFNRHALLAMAQARLEVAGREHLGTAISADDPVLNIIIGNITINAVPQAAMAHAPADMDATTAPAEQPVPALPATAFPVAMEGHANHKATHPSATPGPNVKAAVAAAIETMRNNKRLKMTKKALSDCEVAGALFVDLMGDMPAAAVTEDVAETFVERLLTVPAMHGRAKEIRDLPLAAAIALADVRDEDASLTLTGDDAPKVSRLSYGTINKHLTSLQTCFGKHLPRNEEGKTGLLAVRFSKKEVKENPAFKRTELTDDRVLKTFTGPVFTGYGDSDGRRFEPGNILKLDVYYWTPLLALLSGICLEEALQLRPDDIATRDGIQFINIGSVHNGQVAQVKNPARRRELPFHKDLIRLGFPDYVKRMRGDGATRLFPGLDRGGLDGRFGHDFTQWWTAYRRAVRAYARGQDFHSLRHGANRRMVRAKIPLPVVKRVLGHSAGNDMNLDTYFGDVHLPDMVEAVNAISYRCLDIDILIEAQRRLAQ
ncbi:site-specific integrase [Falsiroseomonas sp. E2-1-a20]|uniref:site-specific integrase n=1 Tax=Falsiroseomonas sp. E2-1-a20 TaxID=3239300 RepID=UPI003F2BB84E